ncbi:hypothetical protein A2U01_0105597, partial [Trifolium medium]|nr:hypothetical protein [Trifolium medium]
MDESAINVLLTFSRDSLIAVVHICK